jgi:hypothetical protein
MSTQELITKAAAEILICERPSRITSVAMLEMLKLQADKIAELEKELDWVSVKNCDLIPNTEYLVKCHGGLWTPFLFNIDSKWLINSNFLHKKVFNGLDKVLMKYPKSLKEGE